MPQINGKEVGEVGFGLMGMTWRAKLPPKPQAFAAMQAALRLGSNFWNGGELYGTPEHNSLHLLNEYFTKYPNDAERVVLSIKGGFKPGKMEPDGSEAGIQRSIEECLRVLDGKKHLDLFESARVDPKVPIEKTIGAIAKYVSEGKVGGISLSEVNAESIRRAHKVHPISAVEVEFSLWATDILSNGIAQTCAELKIPIVAYSPLGRGFLTGQIKSFDDLDEHDIRRTMPRFQRDVFDKNLELVRELQKLAARKGCTTGQIGLGWVWKLSGRNGLPTIIPIPGSTTEERVAENLTEIELSEEDLKEIDDILKRVVVVGSRYGGEAAKFADG